MSAVSTPAVLLRVIPYRETSQILWFFTETHGRMNVIAKGTRRSRSGLAGALQLFSRGTLTAHVRGNRDLQTFGDFDLDRSGAPIGSSVFKYAGALVLAEIVLRHTGEAPSEDLFARIDGALAWIADAPEEEVVGRTLARAWGLVDALGYRPYLDRCPSCGVELNDDEMGRLDYIAGGVLCERCGAESEGPRLGPGARAQLTELLTGGVPENLSHLGAHLQLLHDFVLVHLGSDRPLESVAFLRKLIPPSASDRSGADADV